MNLMKINQKYLSGFVAVALVLSSYSVGSIQSSAENNGTGVVATITSTSSKTKENQKLTEIKTTDLGKKAYEKIKALELKYGNREAGTDKERLAAENLLAQFKQMGYRAEIQKFSYTDENDEQFNSQNIIAVKNPDKKKRIIIGAHYDSDPIGTGMDDNGSGTVVVLTMAEALYKASSDYRIDFVLFGAEEAGIWGSEYFADNMQNKGLTKPELMINYDSLIAGDTCNVYVGKTKDSNLKQILDLAKKSKLPLETQNQPGSKLPYGMTIDESDHRAFKNQQIPILYFEATNWSLGEKDGYTQSANPLVKKGRIWHTEQDKLTFIEKTLGDRPLKHLSLFTEITKLFLKDEGIVK